MPERVRVSWFDEREECRGRLEMRHLLGLGWLGLGGACFSKMMMFKIPNPNPNANPNPSLTLSLSIT